MDVSEWAAETQPLAVEWGAQCQVAIIDAEFVVHDMFILYVNAAYTQHCFVASAAK